MKNDQRRFLQYIFPIHAPTLVALWITGLLAAGLSLVTPRVIGHLTNIFSNGHPVDMSLVTRAILLLLASQVAYAGINYWRKWAELRLQEMVARNLMLDTFGRVVRFSADFFRDREVEKINSRVLDDANTVGKFLVSAAVVAPVAVMSMVIFGVVMMVHNIFLGACMVPLALLSRYFVFFDRSVQSQARRTREVWDTIRTQGSEVVTLTPEWRGHYAFDYGLRGLRQSFERLREVLWDTARLQALFQAISPLVYVVQIGTLYWLGALLCTGHSSLAALAPGMTWGEVIEFMLIVQLFQRPSQELGLFLVDWRMTRESQRRVAEFLDQPVVFARDSAGPALPAASEIAYDDVSVVAATGSPILNGVSLTIGAAEHLAFCGPAGCGKSTAMQIVMRGVQPATGSIRLAGRDVEEYDLLSFAQHIAFVAQKPLLMDASIRDNILLGLRRDYEGCLQDASGALDISRLTGVSDMAALNTELLRVIHLVALEDDVLRKCLDNPAPQCAESASLRQRTPDIRASVNQAITTAGESYVFAFNPDAWFPGTVGDNLMGPGMLVSETPAAIVNRLLAALHDDDYIYDLVRIGYRRLRAERLLAVKVAQQAPALLKFLPAHLDAAANVEVDDASLPASQAISPALWQALLGVALASDVESSTFNGAHRDPDVFRQKTIAARHAISAADATIRQRWEDISSGRYVEGISVRENLLGGRINQRIHGAAERIDGVIQSALEQFAVLPAMLLMGLEFGVGEGGKYLSGGQRQKVTIARAIIKNPSILLLDEATASLDESSQAKVVDLLRNGFKDKTVISISHRLSTIRDYDRIVVLDRGEIAQAGSYDALVAAEGIFRELVNQEHGKETRPAEDRPTSARALTDEPAAADLQRSLALSDVFAAMGSEQLAFLVSVAKVVNCKPNTLLFRRGDSGSELYLVLDGNVIFSTDMADSETTPTPVSSCGPGKVFGELAVFGHGVRTLTARTGPATRLLVIGREDLLRLTAADHRIALGLLRAIAKRMIESTERTFGITPSAAGNRDN